MTVKTPKAPSGRADAPLSKSRLLAHLQCPKRLWLQTYHPELAEEDEQAAARMDEGNRVGEIARALHPGGTLIDGEDLTKSCADTARAMREAANPIFEGTIKYEGVLIRADVLVPEGKAWRLIEVKSSTSVKDYHYSDTAIQGWALRGAGIDLARIELAHIQKTFVYPGEGDYRGLFKHVDVSKDVARLDKEVPAWVRSARETVAGGEPDIEPGVQCHLPYVCPFFSHCNPAEPDGLDSHPVDLLRRAPNLSASLREQGYEELRDVPESALTDPMHRRMWRAVRNRRAELDPAAKEALEKLPYPRYYLDFETVQFALPIWPGTRPYAQIPIQWSCHVETRLGAIEHRAFLAEGAGDPRRAFAEELIATVGDTGPIFVYNIAFERTRLRELAEQFDALSKPLRALSLRLIDLLPITVANYYHPSMRGSWSLKSVIPTIDPDLAYDGLEIAHGGMAQQALLEQLDSSLPVGERKKCREALLEYCKHDTLALVELVRFLQAGAPV